MKFKSGDTVNYRGDNGWHIVVADEESGGYYLMKEDDDRRTHTAVCTEEDIFKESKFEIGDYVDYKGFTCIVTNVSSPGRWDQYRYSIKGFDNNVYFETSCQEDDLSEPLTNPVKEEVKMSKFKIGDKVLYQYGLGYKYCVAYIQSISHIDHLNKDEYLLSLDNGNKFVKCYEPAIKEYPYTDENNKLDLYTINTISDKIDEYLEVNGWALESLASITSWIEGLKTGKED